MHTVGESHHTMLNALDIYKSVEHLVPLGDHSAFQKLWCLETSELLDRALKEGYATQQETNEGEQYHSLVANLFQIFLGKAKNPAWNRMTAAQREAEVLRVKKLPQIEQRSEAWYKNYKSVLTASEFSSIFASGKKKRDLVASKAFPSTEQTGSYRLACPTDEMNAIGWGIRFEPVVKQIIEHVDKCRIYECGRVQHATSIPLAASPDGIFESSQNPKQIGRLVEIKCPYSRPIGGEIPADYWIQMQIQMEVTELDECEYVEVNLASHRANHQTVDVSGTLLQGTLYLLKQDVKEGEPFDYKYVYGEIGSTTKPAFPEGYTLLETIPWGFKGWHRKIVQRDRTWYKATQVWQDAFWTDVAILKQSNQLPETPKQAACLISDD